MTAAEGALPDLTGRTAMVTGASGGVGLEIAKALAAAGARVIMPVRNRAKADDAVATIRRDVTDARLTLADLDLTDLASIHDLGNQLLADGDRIDLLVLNAGVVMLGERERHVTGDGFELHFQTNFLGHAVLTLMLLPLLRGGRVVSQLSLAARTGRLDPTDPQLARRYGALRAYGASKVALGAFTVELARRSLEDGLGITAHLCHPGVAPDTGIAATIRARRADGRTADLVRRISNTPEQAAATALAAATTDAPPPAFFVPGRRGQFSGPPIRTRMYRSLTAHAHGPRTWAWATASLPGGKP